MNNLIVEKKFITSSSSQKLQTFRQVKQKLNTIPSYSTIFYDRQNTQSIESQLKQNSKQYLSSYNQPYNNKPEIDGDALTYSHTGSILLPQETLPLFKTIVTLLNSKQHIASHVSHSLGVKGYKSELSTEIGKIVANSFGQYINIAQVLASKLSKEQPQQQKQDKILSLNRELASLKMQNAKLFEKNTKIEEQNHILKRRVMGFKKQQRMSNENLRQDIHNYEKEISIAMSRMNTFQSQVYRRLSIFQNTLIEVSNFRNQMMINTSSIHRWKAESQKYKEKIAQLQKVIEIKENSIQKYVLKECNTNKEDTKRQNSLLKMIAQQKSEQCEQLRKEMIKISEQLSQQKKMYDQMLDKNIALQKELYFMSFKEQNEEQASDSLHIVQETPGISKQYECVDYIHEFCTNI